MKVPRELRSAADERQDIVIARRDYEDEKVIAVDFGPSDDDLTVDTIDGTAIVVQDGRQVEFEIPADASEITTNDGVLTIRE